MRLTADQIRVIREAILDRDPEAKILLFGSRVDDAAKGGDIDLLVLSDCLGFCDVWPLRSRILDQIGWQKLDILIKSKTGEGSAIRRIAIEEGVLL